ncbi:hypothetical protein K439DRAFT_1634501 [Ramaria rubella]|nr:hypothetical protein K439DRAFT_1634501 [Ramaria rubella]
MPGVTRNGHASDPPGESNVHTYCSPPSEYRATGSLAHEMLRITPHTLQLSVFCWVSTQPASRPPMPVLLVALHACRTLTPDIPRCFLANHHDSPLLYLPSYSHKWYAAGLLVVGCCYNLMTPSYDFPLSIFSNESSTHPSKSHLSYNHRSLAAQSPLRRNNSLLLIQFSRNDASVFFLLPLGKVRNKSPLAISGKISKPMPQRTRKYR